MATDEACPATGRRLSIRLPMITGRAGRRQGRSLLVFPLTLLALAAHVDKPDPARALGVDSPQLDRRIRAAGNES